MQFTENSQARLRVPDPLPPVLQSFHPAWKEMVKYLDGEVLTLVREKTMYTGQQSASIDGWNISFTKPGVPTISSRGEPISQWVPTAWLHPVDGKTPCTCPLALLLRDGCQDSSHE